MNGTDWDHKVWLWVAPTSISQTSHNKDCELVKFLKETAPVRWCGTTNKAECRRVGLIFEGHQLTEPTLFARSLRDYFDSCKTACNLTACRDRVSTGLQCCQEQACLPVKSPSLENTHACTDRHTRELTQRHTSTRALEIAVWAAGLCSLLLPTRPKLLVIHLCTEFS